MNFELSRAEQRGTEQGERASEGCAVLAFDLLSCAHQISLLEPNLRGGANKDSSKLQTRLMIGKLREFRGGEQLFWRRVRSLDQQREESKPRNKSEPALETGCITSKAMNDIKHRIPHYWSFGSSSDQWPTIQELMVRQTGLMVAKLF